MVKKKKYAQAIANWPLEERPREKLILKGPESLSDAELLAIFLRVGVKGKNAIALDVHDALEMVNESINSLGLVPQGF